jgi:hypothetical protein
MNIDNAIDNITTMPAKFLSFSTDIRSLCSEKRMEYIEAVVHWCEINNVEVELAALLVEKDPLMKSMIQTEAEDLHILKKTAKLPV